MVPGAGLEPARPYERGILNPLCLPISPPGQRGYLYYYKLVLLSVYGGGTRSRTEIHGFAIRCIANLPFRHSAKYFIILLNFYLKVVWSGKQDLHPVGAPVATTWVRNLTNRKDSAFTSKFKTWSGKRDSNSRPQPWQGCALPLSYSRIIYS